MSLAYNLAASLAATQPDEDLTTLVINHYTRTISIPKGITTLGVESDDDVLRLNFKMPRYLGTVDLYNFNIRVNYINAVGEDDVYRVTDKAISGDYITFSWLVGPTAVAYKGVTKFNVCMVTTDSNSVVKQEYNTAPVSLPVLEGLECDERVVSEYTDILEQWESRLFGIGDTEEAKLLAFSEEQQDIIAEKGAEVLATIPEDYQTTTKLANEGVRTKADAIICGAEGETITVHDSSDDHIRGLRLFGKTSQVKTTGKNLLNNTLTTRTTYGITATTNADDKSITVDGTATGNAFIEVGTVTLPAGTYILSGCPSGGSTSTYTMYVLINGQYYWNNGSEKRFTVNEEKTISVNIRVMEGVAIDNARFYPMVSVEGGAYEPYTGGKPSPSPDYPQELFSIEDLTVYVCGGNLFNFNGIADTDVIKRNADGSITVTLYSAPTERSLSSLAPSLKSGCRYTLYVDTDSSSKIIYLLDTKTTWYNGTTIMMTDELLNSKVYVYGVNGDAPIIIRNIAITPESIEYNGEAYVEPQTIPVNRTLPGLPVTSGGNYTDSNGQQWICDEVDFERGVYVKRIDKLVLDGTAKWTEYTYETTHYGFMIWDLLSETHYRSPGMSNQFRLVGSGSGECIWVGASNACIYAITNEWYDKGLAAWKAHLNETPLEIIYRSTNPIETPLTADELAAFQALKSNYSNTTVLNDTGAWMNLRYNADTETWINSLIDEKIAAAVAKL